MSDLPDGWVEKIDEKSGKPYYVNRTTKQKQWKRPSFEEIAVPLPSTSKPTSNSRQSMPAITPSTPSTSLSPLTRQSVPAMATNSMISNDLSVPIKPKPPSGRPSTSLPTHTIQSSSSSSLTTTAIVEPFSSKSNMSTSPSRPTSSTSPMRPNSSIPPPILKTPMLSSPTPPDTNTARQSSIDSFSQPRVSFADDSETMTKPVVRPPPPARPSQPPPPPPPPKPPINSFSRISFRDNLESSYVEKFECSMDKIGVEDKVGYLMKQSKLLGRWMRRYFVLSDDKLSYYEDEKRANPKEFLIRSTTNLLYTWSGKSYTMVVRELYTKDGNLADDCSIMAQNIEELEEWFLAITAHIHIEYKKKYNINTDYWDEGDVSVSFWKVPYSTPEFKRPPLGVRTLPFVNAPKTGEGIVPGETVEVVQVVYKSENVFLRLADDKGWIFQCHPTDKYHLCHRLKGKYVQAQLDYIYPATFDRNWEVYIRPSIKAATSTTVIITPGMKVSTCALWCADPDPEEEGENNNQEVGDKVGNLTNSSGTSAGIVLTTTFVKLSKEKMWAPIHNHYGEDALRPV